MSLFLTHFTFWWWGFNELMKSQWNLHQYCCLFYSWYLLLMIITTGSTHWWCNKSFDIWNDDSQGEGTEDRTILSTVSNNFYCLFLLHLLIWSHLQLHVSADFLFSLGSSSSTSCHSHNFVSIVTVSLSLSKMFSVYVSDTLLKYI